jgi:hypothetical protein
MRVSLFLLTPTRHLYHTLTRVGQDEYTYLCRQFLRSTIYWKNWWLWWKRRLQESRGSKPSLVIGMPALYSQGPEFASGPDKRFSCSFVVSLLIFHKNRPIFKHTTTAVCHCPQQNHHTTFRNKCKIRNMRSRKTHLPASRQYNQT